MCALFFKNKFLVDVNNAFVTGACLLPHDPLSRMRTTYPVAMEQVNVMIKIHKEIA